MNAAVMSSVPSRWRLKPAEERISEVFHDERRMRSELAATEQSRDIAWFGIYVFGGAAILTMIGLFINLAMSAFGAMALFPQQAGFLMAAMCMGSMFSIGNWRTAERYVAALKVIHQHHAAVDSNHEMPHV